MGQLSTDDLAELFTGWHLQAAVCHQLLRSITRDARDVTEPGDGYVHVRIPAAVWHEASVEAMLPPPRKGPTP